MEHSGKSDMASACVAASLAATRIFSRKRLWQGRRDAEAFERIWRTQREDVRRIAVRLSGDPDAAEDLTQEVALTALNAYARFEGRSSVRTWLFRITIHAAHRYRERHGRAAVLSLTHSLYEPVSTEKGPEDVTLAAQTQARLRTALDTLPDDLRDVLVLRVYEELKYREIADVLEIPTGTVMSRLHAARQRLQKEIEPDAL